MYIVNIGSISNSLGDPNFFIGTGFMGEKFSTYEELRDLVIKYGKYTDKESGKRIYHNEIKLTFSTCKANEVLKDHGDKQAKECGQVNLFSAILASREHNPFRDYTLYFIPHGGILKDGSDDRVFYWLLDNKDKIEPRYDVKLKDILIEIGMSI